MYLCQVTSPADSSAREILWVLCLLSRHSVLFGFCAPRQFKNENKKSLHPLLKTAWVIAHSGSQKNPPELTDSCVIHVCTLSVCVLPCLCTGAVLKQLGSKLRRESKKAGNFKQHSKDSGIFFCSYVRRSAALLLPVIEWHVLGKIWIESLKIHWRGCASTCAFLY